MVLELQVHIVTTVTLEHWCVLDGCQPDMAPQSGLGFCCMLRDKHG